MVIRRGLGKGKGKGYKNLIPKDPKVHSMSAKGIKQPQKLSPRLQTILKKHPEYKNLSFDELKKKGVFLRYQSDSDGDGVVNIHDCRPIDSTKQDLPDWITKTGRSIKKFAKKEIKGIKKSIEEKKKKQAIERAKLIEHPLIKKLEKQQARVEELKREYQTEDDEDLKKKLDEELDKEQEQLRQIQEKITHINLEDLSDAELKTLAIRYKEPEGLFSSFFGSSNPYKDELLRRQRKKAELERELKRIETENQIELEKLKKELAEKKKAELEDEGGWLF